MARVITFSRVFPAYHPKKGKPTYFIEKFLRCFTDGTDDENEHFEYYCELMEDHNLKGFDFDSKGQTIRSGKHWNAGENFSPRFWSGKPYASKQVIFSPDVKIDKVYDIDIKGYKIYVNGKLFYHQHVSIWHNDIERLAKNDGLTTGELFDWFELSSTTDFSGQIIVWDKSINY